VKNLCTRDFKVPKDFPEKIEIAAESQTWDASSHFGSWKRTTPDEIIHAFIIAIARDVKANAKDAILKSWRLHVLSATFSFLVLDRDEDIFWKTNGIREDMKSLYQAVARTAIQRVLEIARYKATREATQGKLSNAKISELYREKLDAAAGTEKISEKYVDTALKVNDFLLSVGPVKSVIFALEEQMGQLSPFNSVHRLACFFSKTKDAAALTWVFNCVYDFFASRNFNPEEKFSVETLAGAGSNGKGDLDLWLMKLKLHEHLLGPFMEKLPFNTDSKTELRKVFKNQSSYRTRLKPLDGKPDMSWCVSWPDSSLKDDRGRHDRPCELPILADIVVHQLWDEEKKCCHAVRLAVSLMLRRSLLMSR
jgi:hypothetical protein